MSQFSNISRGILRNSEGNSGRQSTSQNNPLYASDEVYSRERNINYHSDPANVHIYAVDDEDLIRRTNSKSQNINADLYAQALAAKSSLGLLDARSSSAIEVLRSYDSQKSKLTSPRKKPNLNPHSSQLSRGSFQQTPDHHPSFHNDLEEDLFSFKYTGTPANTNPDQPVAFKPLTNLNLNSVDDEDEFLYGDSNPLSEEKSPLQNEVTKKSRSNELYCDDDDFLDDETPGFEKYQKNRSLSKSKELSNDENSNKKFSISTYKKRSTWNYSDEPIADNRPTRQEPFHSSKQYKESSGPYSNSPSVLNERNYEPYLHYNPDKQSRPSIPFETTEENSPNFSEFNSPALKLSSSSLNEFVSSKDNSKSYEASAHLLRKQLNLDKPTETNTPYDDEFFSIYNEPPQNERRVIYDSEKKAADKSLATEPLKFPKLLINVQQGDSSPSKRVVQVKERSSYKESHGKSESSKTSTRKSKKSGDSEIDKSVYKSDDLGSRRIVRENTKVSREPKNVSSKDETRALPKRYIEKSHKKAVEAYIKPQLDEKPKNYSDKYHYFREGFEPFPEYGSRSKSHKLRSPERHWSPSYSPRYNSPSNSPRRRSPEYHRRRSPSYSPPSSRSRNRSPSYRYRVPSPSYRSHDLRWRSPERSSRREKRSSERSPYEHSRYRSHGRSPSWPETEKDSWLSQDGSPGPNVENKKNERTVIKRKRNYTSDEQSDDEQGLSVAELKDKIKRKEPPVTLKETKGIKSDAIPSKKSKMPLPGETEEEKFQKSQHPDAVSKIIHGLRITKNASDSFAKKDQQSEIPGNSPDSKDKRSEMMNSLLNKLGISSQFSSSTSTVTTTVAPTTSWTAEPIVTPAPVPAPPQQLNVSNVQPYGMQYSQPLTSGLTQMYPQYMYGASSVPSVPVAVPPPPVAVPPPPPVSHFPPPYNPMYPPPISTTSTFNYPPPVPPTTNNLGSISFQISSRAINPINKNRCLKTVPVVNSSDKPDMSVPPPSLVWIQSSPLSPTKYKMANASGTMTKDVFSQNAVVEQSPETEQNMVERYKKLLEEKGMITKILKNTSDSLIKIRNFLKDSEKKMKLSKSSLEKQLSRKFSNFYEKSNDDLKRYIDEGKRIEAEVKELQTKIKPETLERIAKEVPEKKASSVKYAGYDTGGHWCLKCNQPFPTIPKMMEHLHSDVHIKHVNPLEVIKTEPPKESYDRNVKLMPVKGVEFMKPLSAFHCSLCDETLPNQSYAEYHLKGSGHIEKYLTFLKENPIYEKKCDLFKEAAVVALASEKRQKDLEDARLAKQLIKAKQASEIQVKKLDSPKITHEKLQQLKEKEYEELEEKESSMNAQTQKSGIKLTLGNEKSKANDPLEPAVSKASEVKPKTKVVYIGRAPNYRPRTKVTEKKSSTSSVTKIAKLNANSYMEDGEGRNSPNVSVKEESTLLASATLPADEKLKTIKKKLAESVQNLGKNQTASPKRRKNVPGCQSEAEAKESGNVCDSDKQSFESSKMPTDNFMINKAITDFLRSRKNATPMKTDDNLSDVKSPEIPSEISSHVVKSSPNVSSKASPLVSSPKASPLVSSPKASPLVSSPKASPLVSSPKPSSLVSSPKPSSLVSSPVSSSMASSPVLKKQPMTEEERDFLLLGISKSDMEPLAIPRPPPSNLIHNHSDAVSKFQSFPPPLQVPPPNIISNVPPPNITSQVPPPNIISKVPPPNITSQVPPPNITSQVPPPNVVLQWSSEQKQQSRPIFSNVSLSNNIILCNPAQSLHISAIDDTSVMDMEIDNDLICSEIRVGSDIPSTEKELTVTSEPVISKPAPSSLSAGEILADTDSKIFHVEDDERSILKNFLSSLMDTVTKEVVEDFKDQKSPIKSISENVLLSPNETSKTKEMSSDNNVILCSSSVEQSVSISQSENSEESSTTEKTKKNTKMNHEPVAESSETFVQHDNDDKIYINDPVLKDLHPNNVSEAEKIIMKKEKSTSNMTEESHDVEDQGISCSTSSMEALQESISSKVATKQDSTEDIKTVYKSEHVEPIQSIDSEYQQYNELISPEAKHKENDKTDSNQRPICDLTETEVVERSPISSSAVKTEVKEETDEKINALNETLPFENLSCEQSGDIKTEIKEEFDEDVSISLNLSEVANEDTNVPVKIEIEEKVDLKTVESSLQVQSFNDFTNENSNIKEEIDEQSIDQTQIGIVDETKPSEDFQSQPLPFLEKYDTDDVLSNMSTDGPPLLCEQDESANKPFTEELNESTSCATTPFSEVSDNPFNEEAGKIRSGSDTDEYEAAEN